MKPWKTVERAKVGDGAELTLAHRDDEWVIRLGGQLLMSSRTHGSEDALAQFSLERVKAPKTVLVGGLGLGFTLRAVLDRVGPAVNVVTAELFPALVEWHRTHVGHLARRPLEDPRVEVRAGDVLKVMRGAPLGFDVILLDVDNGPTAVARDDNRSLYSPAGIARCRQALRRGGVLGVWSAGPDERYRERLTRNGFQSVEVKNVTARGTGKGERHVLFLAKA